MVWVSSSDAFSFFPTGAVANLVYNWIYDLGEFIIADSPTDQMRSAVYASIELDNWAYYFT